MKTKKTKNDVQIYQTFFRSSLKVKGKFTVPFLRFIDHKTSVRSGDCD